MARTGWDDGPKLWETMGFLQRHAEKCGFFGGWRVSWATQAPWVTKVDGGGRGLGRGVAAGAAVARLAGEVEGSV
jgi:hypothetical protein